MRIDTVHRRLAELTTDPSSPGVSAGELATDLSLARTNVSADLNKLCGEGKAIKDKSRPVLYRVSPGSASTERTDAFSFFGLSAPSLKEAIEQARAAVLYPPHGMSVLMLGETGVGKSAFAERIHRFAVETGVVGDRAPLIIFNCADYASNPQLLVAQLFGTRRGAFTGADADKAGLIEKADGGFLFLDEVHRLPPEGQEILFTFLDRGTFRRLGDSESERTASVRLMAATTEEPESALLRTFTRRFPMRIEIPSLRARGSDERLELLKRFFTAESIRLGKPIAVSVNSIRSLLSYDCPNNIGQLKNDIQLICAKAYSDYVSGKRSEIQIISADLPSHIKRGLLSETSHRQIWRRIASVDKRFCFFDGTDQDAIFEEGDAEENIYEVLDRRVRELREGGVGSREVEKRIDAEIDAHFERYYANLRRSGIAGFSDAEEGAIGRVVRRIRDLHRIRIGRELEASISNALAIHILYAAARIRDHERISNPDLNAVRERHPTEFHLAAECLKIIDEELETLMPLEEAGFLTMFFAMKPARDGEADRRVRVVVVAHGDSTASSLAGTCNTLLGTPYAVGIDAPLNASPGSTYERMERFLRENGSGRDVLLLVDMGSLSNFAGELEQSLGVAVRSVPLVSTLHVLQATRKAMLGHPLERVLQETLSVTESAVPNNRGPQGGSLSDSLLQSMVGSSGRGSGAEGDSVRRTNRDALKSIVTVCASGEGNAMALKKRFEAIAAPPYRAFRIVPLAFVGISDIGTRLQELSMDGGIACVVSPFSLDVDVPVFGADVFDDPPSRRRFFDVLDRELLFSKIVGSAEEALFSIEPEKAFEYARIFISRVETDLGRRLNDGVHVGVSYHIACMLDRAMRGEKVREFPRMPEFAESHGDILSSVRVRAEILAAAKGSLVEESELFYLASFFNPENCVK